MHTLSEIFNAALCFAVLSQTVPILLAALGGAFTQQANILNVALDGIMLMGAFSAISVGAATQNIWAAIAAAVVTGLALAVLFGWVSLWLGADFIVAGIGIGLLTSGVSLFLLERLYHSEGNYTPHQFPHLPDLRLGPLAHIPILGWALEGQSIIVVAALVLVPVSHHVLYRTRFGLHLRAVGEDEAAAVAAGLRPRTIRMGTVLISGALAGLAGAQLAMGQLDQFVTQMTGGRGFIALAALFVGGATPWGTFLGSLIFGFATAVADQLQFLNLPSDLVLMVPYGVTVAVLLFRPVAARVRVARRSREMAHE